MSKSRMNIAAMLSDSARNMLLRTWIPTFENVWCRHVMYAYGVPQGWSAYPDHEVWCRVVGYHRSADTEALVVKLDELTHQPLTGKLLHVTMSTAPDVPPAQAGFIEDWQNVTYALSFNVRLKPMRLWLATPQSRSDLVAA